ncbi:MAG: serine hydrolase domain-containing protein, partial [Chitinophagales bacterium]
MNTKFFIFYVGICLILMPSRVHGQQKTSSMVLPSASPETVDVSDEYLAAVDEYIESYVQQNKLPGGVFLIARKGKTIYHKGIGHWTPEKKQAYETEAIFRLASMTKAITTVAILQLYEQGKLGLDDPIKYYLPAFAHPEILDTYNESDTTYTTTKARMSICIRHLLTHTSGIVYGSFNPGKIKAIYEKLGLNEFGLHHTSKTTADMVNDLAKAPLIFEPGTEYKYGLNMEVLG